MTEMTVVEGASQPSLLVVEDDEVLAKSVTSWFRRSGFKVDVAHDGRDASEKVSSQAYDVVLLDLLLPEKGGMDVLAEARKVQPPPGVVIASALMALSHKVDGLNAGADDYVTKPFDMTELEARIRAVLRRRNGRVQSKLTFGDISIDLKTGTAAVADSAIPLTPTEFRILAHLVEKGEQVCRREILLDLLSVDGGAAGDNLLDVNIHRLRRKLDSSGVQISAVRGIGFRILPAHPQ